MPDLTGQAAQFRTRQRYHFNGHLGFVPQTAIFDRAVNMATITYSLTTITFDDPYTGAGAFGDIKEGMTVIIYDGDSATIKGYLRVATGAASSTVLQVNEFSKGYIDLTDDDKFAVFDHYLLWDQLVAANAMLDKDSRTTYSAQLADYAPIPNGGGAWFGFVDSDAAIATIQFDASTSIIVDPDNGSGLTYVWDVGDGTITVGVSTDAAITATFPAGFRHVQLTVTDADNSNSAVKQIPVYVYDRDSNLPQRVAMETLEYDGSGMYWRATFSAPAGSEADISNLPDGSFIAYFEDEYYGTTNASYGSNTPIDRAHIKFTGYLVSDSIRIDDTGDTVTFEATGPLGVLESIGALPQLLISDASPSNWQELETLTVRRALWYLIYWHSTALTYFDFIWPAIPSALSYARLAVQDTSSIAGQLRDVGDSLGVDVSCDRQGVIRLIEKPHLLTVAERDTRTTTYDLTKADILSVDLERDHRWLVKLVTGEGITTSSDPVFSKAPGIAPGPGTGNETLSSQIVASQADMNQRSGDHLAWLNGTYYNETTKQIELVPKSLRLAVPDGYDWADPAHREFMTLTLAATLNKRGVSFASTAKWVLESVSIQFDPELGTKDIEWQLRHETHGPAGVTYIPPQAAANGLPSLPDFDLQFPGWGEFELDFGGEVLNPAIGIIAGFNTDGYVYFTTAAADFNTPSGSGGPVWTRTDLTGLATPLVSTLQSFVVDAFSPGYTGTPNGAINGWIATNTNIYRITDIFSQGAGIALTDLHTFATTADLMQRAIDASFGFQNKVVVASLHGGATSQMDWAYSTDGSTFNEVTITSVGGDNASGAPSWSGLHISSKISGLCYTNGFQNAAGESWIYKSTDWGATWAIVTPNIDTHDGIAGGPAAIYTATATVHVPFNDNPNDTLLWAAGVRGNGALAQSQRLYVATIDSTIQADITPTTTGPNNWYAPCHYQRSMASLGSNRQRMAFISLRTLGSGISHLWTTTTGGLTKASWIDGGVLDDLHSLALTGEPNSGQTYLWGRDGAISYSDDIFDASPTIDSRIGNIASLGSPGVFVNICGKGT